MGRINVRADAIDNTKPFATFAVDARDSQGNLVAVENVNWDSSDNTLGTITTIDNVATLKLTGKAGHLRCTVVGDADPAQGIELPFLGSIDIDILPSVAVTFEIVPTLLQTPPAVEG